MERIPKTVLISVLLILTFISCSSQKNQSDQVFSSYSKQFESYFDSIPDLDMLFSPDSSELIWESMLLSDDNIGKIGHLIIYQPMSKTEIAKLLAHQGLLIRLDPILLSSSLDSVSYDEVFMISHKNVDYTLRKRIECGVLILSIGNMTDNTDEKMIQNNSLIPRIMQFDAILSKNNGDTIDVTIETENGLISVMSTTDSLVSFQYQSLHDFKIVFRNSSEGFTKKIGVLPSGCLSLPEGGYLFEFDIDISLQKDATIYSGEYFFSRSDQSFLVRKF